MTEFQTICATRVLDENRQEHLTIGKNSFLDVMGWKDDMAQVGPNAYVLAKEIRPTHSQIAVDDLRMERHFTVDLNTLDRFSARELCRMIDEDALCPTDFFSYRACAMIEDFLKWKSIVRPDLLEDAPKKE